MKTDNFRTLSVHAASIVKNLVLIAFVAFCGLYMMSGFAILAVWSKVALSGPQQIAMIVSCVALFLATPYVGWRQSVHIWTHGRPRIAL